MVNRTNIEMNRSHSIQIEISMSAYYFGNLLSSSVPFQLLFWILNFFEMKSMDQLMIYFYTISREKILLRQKVK